MNETEKGGQKYYRTKPTIQLKPDKKYIRKELHTGSIKGKATAKKKLEHKDTKPGEQKFGTQSKQELKQRIVC